MNPSECQICKCTTGGGLFCYEHAPYIVHPQVDGTFIIDRNGQRSRVSYEHPDDVAGGTLRESAEKSSVTDTTRTQAPIYAVMDGAQRCDLCSVEVYRDQVVYLCPLCVVAARVPLAEAVNPTSPLTEAVQQAKASMPLLMKAISPEGD